MSRPLGVGAIRPTVPVGVAMVLTRFNVHDLADRPILLIRRHGRHGTGTWAVPGGWLEPGEGPLAGALRETREEVGCELGEGTRVRFVGYTHTLHAEGIEDICLWFGARAPREYEARIAEPARIGAVGWYERGALPTPLFAPVLAALDQGILAQATFL